MRSDGCCVRAACFVFLVVSTTACAGTLEDPDRFRVDAGASDADVDTSAPNTCGSVENDILHAKCGTAGCHATTGAAAGLDLQLPDILGRLAGKAPTGGPGVLIVKGDPASSVLYQKLTATPPF